MRYLKIVILVAAIIVSSVGGCDDSDDVNEISTEIESLLTISQGVYGQTTTYDDVGNNSVEYLPSFGIEVFIEDPSLERAIEPTPVSTATSGEMGFYEIELEQGHYWLCTLFKRCVEIDIAIGQLLRADYEFSAGPGWFFPNE